MYITEQYVDDQIPMSSLLLEGPIDYLKSKFGSNLTKLNVWKKSVSARLKKNRINEMKVKVMLKKKANKYIKSIGKSLARAYANKNYKAVGKQFSTAMVDGYSMIKKFVLTISWTKFTAKIAQGLMLALITTLGIFFMETLLTGSIFWMANSATSNMVLTGIQKIVFSSGVWLAYYLTSYAISMIFIPTIKESMRLVAVSTGIGSVWGSAMTVADVFRASFYYTSVGLNKGFKLSFKTLIGPLLSNGILHTIQNVVLFVGDLPFIKKFIGPWAFAISVGISALWENMITPFVYLGTTAFDSTPGRRVFDAADEFKKNAIDPLKVGYDKSKEWLTNTLHILGIDKAVRYLPKMPDITKWPVIKQTITLLNSVEEKIKAFATRNVRDTPVPEKGVLSYVQRASNLIVGDTLDKLRDSKRANDVLGKRQHINMATKMSNRGAAVKNYVKNILGNPKLKMKASDYMK